jgi:N-formylmaleamate deformylase
MGELNQDFQPSYPEVRELVPAHWHEQSLTTNGIRQHFYRTGGTKPAVLLLHGFSENGLCWLRVARALEADYDAILLDARCHGRSSGPEGTYGQDVLTQDTLAFLEALNLQHLSLLGYSTGALTACQVAATVPERIWATILLDPPLPASAPSARPPVHNQDGEPWPGFTAWQRAWFAWHRALREQSSTERVMTSQPFLPPGTNALTWPVEDLVTHLEAQAQLNLDLFQFVPPLPQPLAWRETSERVSGPLLLIASQIYPPELAQQIVAKWPRGQLLQFANRGHFLHHEMQGEEFAGLVNRIQEFLATAEM